jgi:hypothetical protein
MRHADKKYEVVCVKHNYHSFPMYKGAADSAAEMHRLLPCNEVTVKPVKKESK